MFSYHDVLVRATGTFRVCFLAFGLRTAPVTSQQTHRGDVLLFWEFLRLCGNGVNVRAAVSTAVPFEATGSITARTLPLARSRFADLKHVDSLKCLFAYTM